MQIKFCKLILAIFVSVLFFVELPRGHSQSHMSASTPLASAPVAPPPTRLTVTEQDRNNAVVRPQIFCRVQPGAAPRYLGAVLNSDCAGHRQVTEGICHQEVTCSFISPEIQRRIEEDYFREHHQRISFSSIQDTFSRPIIDRLPPSAFQSEWFNGHVTCTAQVRTMNNRVEGSCPSASICAANSGFSLRVATLPSPVVNGPPVRENYNAIPSSQSEGLTGAGAR